MEQALTLTALKPGEHAVIVRYLSTDAALLRFREMGLLPGTAIKLIRRAPLGDPLEISVRGSLLSVRKGEASMIEVQRHVDQ